MKRYAVVNETEDKILEHDWLDANIVNLVKHSLTTEARAKNRLEKVKALARYDRRFYIEDIEEGLYADQEELETEQRLIKVLDDFLATLDKAKIKELDF